MANGEGAWGRRRCPTPDAEEPSLNDDQGRDAVSALNPEHQQWRGVRGSASGQGRVAAGFEAKQGSPPEGRPS
jgi:hypothetical protein